MNIHSVNVSRPLSANPPRNRNWLWYFGILVVLTAASIATMIAFNLRQQLKPAQLAAAAARWKQRGPRDYDMTYTKKLGEAETYAVQVRNGVVVSAQRNRQPVEERLLRHYSMNALFSDIERFLEIDAEPGRPKTFCVATFDPEDGHIRHYVRRVMGSSERVEISVDTFTPK